MLQKVNLEQKDKLITGTGNISKHSDEDAPWIAVVRGQLASCLEKGKIITMSYIIYRIKLLMDYNLPETIHVVDENVGEVLFNLT